MECKFCKEDIIDGAIKCKHCGSVLTEPMAGWPTANSLGAFECYTTTFKKFAIFSGRATRREYWYFMLFNITISLVLGFVDGLIGTFDPAAGIGVIGGLYTLAALIPAIAVGVRRLHDTDRSGWWLLLALIPLIGAIVLIVFFVQDSKLESNQHGTSPKLVTA